MDFAHTQPANILRGAFGTIFRRIACKPECPGPTACEWRTSCPYALIFEPSATSRGPSGLADWPRPFVFRAMHLAGCKFAAGARFHFDINWFDTKNPSIAHLVLTFAELAREGLGPRRRRVQLLNVAELNEKGKVGALVYEGGPVAVHPEIEPLAFDLDKPHEHVSSLKVQFLTPTELKSGQRIGQQPDFAVLAGRVRDRISTLRELYGAGALEIDFKGFGQRAARVKTIRCEIVPVDAQRRSSRTGQVHSIGGFVGEADYEGDLTEFIPYLKVAQWTGVGRQTVWGKGAIAVSFRNAP